LFVRLLSAKILQKVGKEEKTIDEEFEAKREAFLSLFKLAEHIGSDISSQKAFPRENSSFFLNYASSSP
jgi:hypothetical protein